MRYSKWIPLCVILFVLCSCRPQETPIASKAVESEQSNTEVQESSSSSDESLAQSEQPVSLAQQILNKKLDDAFSAEFKKRLLEKFHVTPSLKNISLLNDTSFTGTLHLENTSGKTYALDIQGQCYLPTNLSAEFPVVNWGGICIVDTDTLALITLNTVTLLDANSLEEKSFSPDLSVLPENSTVVGVYRNENGGYFIPVVVEDLNAPDAPFYGFMEQFFNFDARGELIATIPVSDSSSFVRRLFEPREFCYAEEIFMPTWEGNQYLIIPNLAAVYRVNPPENLVTYFANQYDNGPNTLLITDISNESGGTAFYYEQNRLISALTLPKCNPGMFDSSASYSQEETSKVEWDENHTIQIANDYFDTTISINLPSNTTNIRYHLNPDHIRSYSEEYPPLQSPNERYRIVETSVWSPFLIPNYFTNAWLQDIEKDQYNFIDVFTAYYGGGGDICDFIDDSRFYRMDFPGPITIYNIVDSKPQPAFTLSGRVDSVPETTYTLLGSAIAVTYSASHRQYYVLEIDEKSADLAIYSENGKLVSRHTTHIPITYHLEGIERPDISVSGDTLYYESSDLDGDVKGSLDLTTFEFVQEKVGNEV